MTSRLERWARVCEANGLHWAQMSLEMREVDFAIAAVKERLRNAPDLPPQYRDDITALLGAFD